jgi:hypothetical protein
MPCMGLREPKLGGLLTKLRIKLPLDVNELDHFTEGDNSANDSEGIKKIRDHICLRFHAPCFLAWSQATRYSGERKAKVL